MPQNEKFSSPRLGARHIYSPALAIRIAAARPVLQLEINQKYSLFSSQGFNRRLTAC